MENFIKRIDRVAIFIIIYSIIFVLIFTTLGYTLPFVLAIAFALCLKRPTRFLMNRFKFTSAAAALITTITFFTVIIIIFSLTITAITNEVIKLTETLSSYAAEQSHEMNPLIDRLHDFYNDLDPVIVKSINDALASTASTAAKLTADIGKIVLTAFFSLVYSIPYLLMVVIFTLIATYFFTKDISKSRGNVFGPLFNNNADRILNIYKEAKRMLFGYLRSYLIIVFITFIVTLIGFLILGVRYAFVLSILCGFLDFLPILGTIVIYLPLIIYYLAQGNLFIGIGLIGLYVFIAFGRQVIEPKIVSSSLGLHPVAVLAAIFIGLKAHGIIGMIFCMFLVIFYNILKKVNVI
jgi:sporulation integral membrane protein YtvI